MSTHLATATRAALRTLAVVVTLVVCLFFAEGKPASTPVDDTGTASVAPAAP